VRYLLLIVIFALPVHGQKESPKPDGQQNHSESARKPSPSPVAHNTTPENSNEASNDPKSYLSRLFSPENLPNIGLLVAGVAGICVAINTLKAIKRQAEWMKRQTTILVEYNKATREAANAAIENANAAKASIGMVVSKERARLRIEVDDLALPKGINPFSLITVKYRVRLWGPTAAIIVNTRSDAIVSESEEPPNEPLMSSLSLPAIISPSDPPAERYQLIIPSPDLEKDILSIKSDKKFVHFWGVIHYQDVFERHYWLRFRYVWKFTSFVKIVGTDGDRIGRWHEIGSPEDNSETQGENPN